MAILTCIECEGKVSSRATACPHCGCPIELVALAAASQPLTGPPSSRSIASRAPAAGLADVPSAPALPESAASVALPEKAMAPLPLEVLTLGGTTTFSLARPVTVGRSHANILVEHQDIAPAHCHVEPGNGSWRVTDTGDKGLFSRGERVASADLHPGELVDLGGFPGPVALALPATLDEPLPLRLRVPGLAEKPLLLQKLPMLIGRAPWVDLPLADRNVSHVHARVRIDGGRVVLDDLQSRNGTWVNGERIRTARELRYGDRVQTGETELVFGPDAAEWGTTSPREPAAAAASDRSEREGAEAALAAFAAVSGEITPPPRHADVVMDPTRTRREMPQVVIPPGLTIEQLAAAPEAHVHVPPERMDTTRTLPAPGDDCPSCGEELHLRSIGVITGALRLARSAVRIVGRARVRTPVGRCGACGARLARCPACASANAAPTLSEPIGCSRCGDAFVPA